MEKVREKVLFALQEVQRAVIGKQEVTETVMKARRRQYFSTARRR